MTDLTRREMMLAGAAMPILSVAFGPAIAADASADAPGEASAEATGPLLGHVDHETAILWYRPGTPGEYTATLTHTKTGKTHAATATASPEHDLCITWRFDRLEADAEYTYTIAHGERAIVTDKSQWLRTAPPVDQPARTVLTMGSCASHTDFFDIWTRIAEQKPDALMLLGDTPYIDNSDLSFNRLRHRQFLSMPTLAALGAHTPIWGTWDDHDFGGNDTDGRVRDKHLIRQAFSEYRAQTAYGDGEHGVYTRFRRGPVEVFMIDPRYFAQTEPSPVDPQKTTCLGKTQWQWLRDGLVASTAPFKVLATGMIWDDKHNGEKDDWETYAHEREAIFDFIGENRIAGVVLIGGDIHVSRHLRYPMQERIGYDLHQFITSPLHERIIPSLNKPHPNLLWGEPIPNIFLRLVCDTRSNPATLVATWIDIQGNVHREVKLSLADLTPA